MHFNFLHHLHWPAVIVAGLAYFLLGAIWYSKALFSKKWIAYTKIDMNTPDASKGIAGIFISSFILMVITSIGLAILVYKMQTVGWKNGLHLGLVTGVCIGITSISISYLYEKRPLGLHLINGGYTLVGHIIAAIILSVWH